MPEFSRLPDLVVSPVTTDRQCQTYRRSRPYALKASEIDDLAAHEHGSALNRCSICAFKLYILLGIGIETLKQDSVRESR